MQLETCALDIPAASPMPCCVIACGITYPLTGTSMYWSRCRRIISCLVRMRSAIQHPSLVA